MRELTVAGVVSAPLITEASVFAGGRLFVTTGGVVSEIDTSTSSSRRAIVTESSNITAIDIDIERNLLVAIDTNDCILAFNASTHVKVMHKKLRCHPVEVKLIDSYRPANHIAIICHGALEIWELSNLSPCGPVSRIFMDKLSEPPSGFAVQSFSNWFVLTGTHSHKLFWYDELRGYQKGQVGKLETPVALSAYGHSRFVSLDASGNLTEWLVSQELATCSSQLIRDEKIKNEAKIACAAFNRDASCLSVITIADVLHLFHVGDATEIERHTLGFPIQRCVFDKLGGSVALLAPDRIAVWEPGCESLKYDRRNHLTSVSCTSLSDDGTVLITGSHSGVLNVWSAQDFLCLATFSEHKNTVSAVRCIQNGNVFVSASLDGTVRAYDMVRFRHFRIFTPPFACRLNDVSADDSGELICASDLDTFQILIWSLKTAQLLDVLSGHTGVISSLTFCTGVIVSGSWDNTVRVWDMTNSDHNYQVLPHNRQVLALAVSLEKKQIAVSISGQQLLFWNMESSQPQGSVDFSRDVLREQDDKTNIVSLAYDLSATMLVASTPSGNICIYDTSAFVLLRRYTFQSNLSSTSNHILGELSHSDGSDSWSIVTSQGVYVFKFEAHDALSPSMQLDENTSLSNVLAAWQRMDFHNAVLSAVSLRKSPSVLCAMLYNIPIEQQKAVLLHAPATVTDALLTTCNDLILSSVHLEYILITVMTLLHASLKYRTNMKLLKRMSCETHKKQHEVEITTNRNICTLNFICAAFKETCQWY